MRRVVLERCGEIGFKAQEVDLELSELYAADEIFMTNAIIGVQPIASLDDRSFPSRDASRRLREHLGLKTDA